MAENKMRLTGFARSHYLYTAPGNAHAVQSEAGCVVLVSVPQEVEKLRRESSGA